MKRLLLSAEWFEGAVSVERREDGWKPWRIPYADYELYPPDGIGGKAEITAGIRLRFRSNSSSVVLTFKPLPEAAKIDCLIENRLAGTAEPGEGASSAEWRELTNEEKLIEIWLPQNVGITIISLFIEADASAEPVPDQRPKWLTYGSSITQCVAAESPTQTWPAIAAREAGLHLTCLGYSGNCQMETMVARLIRDMPADFISLCLGINVYGAASLSARTLRPAVIGMLETIREKHGHTPILLISPIYSSERETKPNKLDLTVRFIREEIAEVAELMKRRGDYNLHYRNGLEWLGEADACRLPDGLHPDAQGYRLMGERFLDRIAGPVPLNLH